MDGDTVWEFTDFWILIGFGLLVGCLVVFGVGRLGGRVGR